MRVREQWIWLPRDTYPDNQNCAFAYEDDKSSYTVATIKRDYNFNKSIEKVKLYFSGDTFFRFFCNGKYIANGPASVGGDFLSHSVPYAEHYATEYEITKEMDCDLQAGKLSFNALLRMTPVRICEYSQGRGGFFLHGEIFFSDDTKAYIATDETWLIKRENSYIEPNKYDEGILQERYVYAQRVQNIWHTQISPIPPCVETKIYPIGENCIRIRGGETRKVEVEFDKIYAGYIDIATKQASKVFIQLDYYETEARVSKEEIRLVENQAYRGVDFHSVGRILATICNQSNEDAELEICFWATCYPIDVQARTETSDKELNQVLEVCAHSLQYCRQSHHLDSPLHSEPLACTGDYYIETLMTLFTFGDLRLSAFDVRRTAELLRYQDGRIFHTSYSLIWPLMLWDVFMATGETQLLYDCEEALHLLLGRFESYIGENGLIENPPNYMFVDWLYPDGINLHHPPKALGQTCLNMFYYGALLAAEKIYAKMGQTVQSKRCRECGEHLRLAIIALLWDEKRGLFFEGLNTPTKKELICDLMPENIEKRYYRKHANILAAYFGVFEQKQCQEILEKVIDDNTLGDVQPYFMHYLLEAIYRNGLREKYTLQILNEWKPSIRECSKGLPEGFYKPNDEYVFDHSHAWAGTPAYALPLALTGFEMKKEGFEEVAFSPCLLGLEYAKVQIPTPYGIIEIEMRKNEEPKIIVPNQIKFFIINNRAI